MNDAGKRSKAICILGMHRSGTSTVARAVNLLGAYIGRPEDMMETNEYNPMGYWEHKDVVSLHDRIFRKFGLKWDVTLPMEDKIFRSQEMAPFREELVDLVKAKFLSHDLWVWKDPRTTLFFPLWKDVLSELGVELCCIFAVRNPLDVANSHKKRDGFDIDRSLGIWQNYNLAALQYTNGLPRSFLSYDHFLADWEKELRRCTSALNIDWPEDSEKYRTDVSAFIRVDLRHSKSDMEDLKKAGVPDPVIELYALLMNLVESTSADDTSCQDTMERLLKELMLYSRFFRQNMLQYFDQILQIEAKNVQIVAKNAEIVAKNAEIATKSAQNLELSKEIENLRKSYSWRITAPLRVLMRLLLRK